MIICFERDLKPSFNPVSKDPSKRTFKHLGAIKISTTCIPGCSHRYACTLEGNQERDVPADTEVGISNKCLWGLT